MDEDDERFQRILKSRESYRYIAFPYHAEFSFTDGYHLSEIAAWLDEHVGQVGTDHMMRWQRGHLVVRFAEERHQTLFCLTWL